MKKRWIAFFLLFLLLALMPGTALANAPAPRPGLTITLWSAPTQAAGIDLLVELSPQDENFSACNEELLKRAGLTMESSLALYSKYGFYSYLAHWKDAGSFFEIEDEHAHFWPDWECREQYELVCKSGRLFKLALFDKEGELIAVSEPINTDPKTEKKYFSGHVSWQLEYQTTDVSFRNKYDGITVFFATLFWAVLFASTITVIVETLIGRCFRLKPLGHIVKMNLLSNVIFNFAVWDFADMRGFPYGWTVAAGEVLVVVCEYFWLRRVYRETPRKRIFIFTLTANAASLAIGLTLNAILAAKYFL